jgi:hypothetical protein
MSMSHNIDLGVNIGVHCQKRKSAIVCLVCVRGVFRVGALFNFMFTLFLLAYVENFFLLLREKILECSPYHELKLSNSLAKEPLSRLVATKCVLHKQDAKFSKSRSPVNCKEQLQASKC